VQSELMRLQDLGKSFGNRKVLKKINMSINEGEIFALMGPSGVGKTTLFRILNLLEKPSEGKLFFRGIELKAITIREKINARRSMSMLFQTPCVLNTTVFNNVAFGLVIRKVDKATIRKKVMNALSIVGLEGKERQKARTLSGGEAQRMAFARAIVYDPDILLLDEPTSNLDPANVAMIEEIIKRIQRERGTTIVFATHNMYQVRRIANRVGILLNGELIEVNNKETIFTEPEDARTKAFVNGEMIY
jgi:tungstate transport system ATP-binding protein